MSKLVDHDIETQPNNNNQFIQKLKFYIHQQLTKYTIIFTITNQNSTFHYYTILDANANQMIELYWIIEFSCNFVSITVTYTTFRTLGIPLVLDDLRNKIEISNILRILNINMPYFLTFILKDKNEVSLSFQRSFFHESDRMTMLKSIKLIINQILQQTLQAFPIIAPYLSIPIQNHLREMYSSPDKKFYEMEEFNLIKLKNTFDRFRKNREKISQLVYEQKDFHKIRKRIQSSMHMLGVELKALTNIRYLTKEIRKDELLKKIQAKQEENQKNINKNNCMMTKVDRIAYQFQILKIQENEKKFDINANSEIYFGKYNFRIFKTLIQPQKVSKSQNYKKPKLQFEQNDIIEERISKLVKKKANSFLSEKALKNQLSFLKFMRNLICLYIANYYLPLDTSSQIYVEHYQESLLNVLGEKKMRSFEERLEIMINLSKGLKFIADENICHRDIKPSNVMLNNQKQPKIIDFGSSISAFNQKVIIVSNEQLCSTKGYYFPYQQCDEKLQFLFTKQEYETHLLFDAYSYGVICQKVFNQQLKEQNNNQSIKDTLTYIVERCKERNPDNRLSYDEIICFLILLKQMDESKKRKNKQIQIL